MKLTYYSPQPSNFGDELNAILWSQLLPSGFLDADESDLFLGVGSILGDYLPRMSRKHVLGSGFGGYSGVPDATTSDWNVVWVRGPLTARAIGVDESKVITDAAVLLRSIDLPAPTPGNDTCFMPHFQSLERGNWQAACAAANVTFLDPGQDPVTLIAKMRGARLIISEAMHGAIVADALRTPWIGIRPFSPQHHPKWNDWSSSMGMDVQWADLPPSTALEAYVKHGAKTSTGPRAKRVSDSFLARPANAYFVQRAAKALSRLAETGVPQLSSDQQIERVTDQCQEALQKFVAAQSIAN